MTTGDDNNPIGGYSTLSPDVPVTSVMDERIKLDWLDALRSGEIHQGSGKLHTATKNGDGTERHEFCCLGVLCELAVAAGVVERVDLSDTDGYRDAEDTVYGYAPTEGPSAGVPFPHYPPQEVATWAGLPHGDTNPYVTRYEGEDPEVPTGRQVIANVNDEGATFETIADLIERQF